MTILGIASGLVSFQTFIFKQDGELTVMGKEGYPGFHTLIEEWKSKGYTKEGYNSPSVEADYVTIYPEKEEEFLKEYPQLAEQLKINTEAGGQIWVEYPKPRNEIDIIHTPEEV